VNPKRRARTRSSLLQHLKTYFPEKYDKEFGRHHLKYIHRIQKIILHGGNQAIGMPRGSGKTAIEKGAVHWALANGYRKFAVIVAASVDEAKSFLDDVKEMFVSEKFAEDFPEIAIPLQRCELSGRLAPGQTHNGKSTRIVIDKTRLKLPTITGSEVSGNIIRCVGIGGKIRGKSEGRADGKTLRPDLIVLDDLQTREDAINPDRVKKIIDKVETDVKGLAGDGEYPAKIMSCTVIEPNDVADQYLNTEIFPDWNGLRISSIEKFPDSLEMWTGQYAELYLRDSKQAARKFYVKHRPEMDKGAVVDWETNFKLEYVDSRLEWLMRLMIENDSSFWSEQQNQPRGTKKASIFVDAKTIRKRLNGYERGIVPTEAPHLTAFIDVHDDLLYWVVAAWSDDFTGFVVDYGTFPDQKKTYFNKSNKNNLTLQKNYSGMKRLGAIRLGVEELLNEILSREFTTAEDTILYVERIMIDTGYSYKAIEAAMARVRSPIVTPTKGVGIGAKSKPMDEYPDRDGEVRGNHWLFTKVGQHRYKTLKIDVNFWKSDVHDSFGLDVSDRGSLSLFGLKSGIHQMFSEHLTNEDVVMVQAGENKVYEWSEKVNSPDNHFFDCMVGCAVAASFIGIKKPHEKDDVARKRRRAKVYRR
jgi:hypothetical protein